MTLNKNIPINKKLLNKYQTAKEIFLNETNNFDGIVNVNKKIRELENIDVEKIKIKELKKLACLIFENHHPTNKFKNGNNTIIVYKRGIYESIEKIFNSKKQRNLLTEHLKVFSDLGDIIEHATLVNQVIENKNREKYNCWHYYLNGLKIGKNNYFLEFEVVSMSNSENHYRMQRLALKKQIDHSGDVN